MRLLIPVKLVYFSSVTENTKNFVDKLGYPAERIPLRRNDPELLVDYKYVLFLPTYGGGGATGAVPKQVIKFLNIKENRDNCIGIINGGNINFNEGWGLAGRIVSSKIKAPVLYNFELRGTTEDVLKVQEGLQEFFANYTNKQETE